jgi:cytochrome c biogenesis protein ResB
MSLSVALMIIGAVAFVGLVVAYLDRRRKRYYLEYIQRKGYTAISSSGRARVARDESGVETLEDYRLVSFSWVRDPLPGCEAKIESEPGDDRSERIL